MVRHIVLWRLKERAHGASKTENARRIKELVEGLRGRVPGLMRLDVAVCAPDEQAADLALVADFTDWAALAAYQDQPEHVAMKPFIMAARESRQVADFELGE